jgi:hypothetical protein
MVDVSQCSILRCIVDLGVGDPKVFYKLTLIRSQVNC